MMEDPHKYKAEAEDMKQILLFLCMVILAIGIDFHGVNFQKLQKSPKRRLPRIKSRKPRMLKSRRLR